MDWSTYLPYAIPAAAIGCAVIARVAGDLSQQKEAKQSSRVQRIEGAVSRIAGEIAETLVQAKAAGSPADVVNALKAAAVAQGADYMLGAMPDTLKDAGATKASLITMLSGEASKQALAATAPALLAGIASGLLPTPAPSASAAPAAAAG